VTAQQSQVTGTPVAPAETPARRSLAARVGRRAIMLSVPVILVLGVGGYWLLGGRYVSTENANLHQARISVAAVIGGRVQSVAIADNQTVKMGDTLFQVDPTPYQLALNEAQVAVTSARISVEQIKVAYAQAVAQAKLAADDAAFQTAELNRQIALSNKGVAPASTLDDARHMAQRATENRDVAQQAVASALAALGGDPNIATDSHPKVQAALVALERAKYNLDQTTVTAPADGLIYQASSFKPGQMVSAGQPLFSLVETGDYWVEANFKETQLADISVGQKVDVTFDLDTAHTYSGQVQAIGAGTGAEFSLLPAQNATGNWVKVTQRVPVRISLDDPQAALLASGMSASVSVDTGRRSGLSEMFAAFAGH
jgi:membrane fusion protein, multidrug efflux system